MLIILFSIAVVIVFFVLAGLIINLIIRIVKKAEINVPKTVIVIALVFVAWAALGAFDVYFIVSDIVNNKDSIVTAGLVAGADIVSKGLVLTFKGIEKNWSTEMVERLGNIRLELLSAKSAVEKDAKVYTIELMFDNGNPNSYKVGLGDLITDNYLFVCDKDDVMYGLDPKLYQSYYLPVGKSKITFNVSVDKTVELAYIRFVERKIGLSSGT